MIRLKKLLPEQTAPTGSNPWWLQKQDTQSIDNTRTQTIKFDPAGSAYTTGGTNQTVGRPGWVPSAAPYKSQSLLRYIGNQFTEFAKNLYWKYWEDGKSCELDNEPTREAAFLKAKKNGCNFFRYTQNGKQTWYNTETDMPIDQELTAYAKDLKTQGFKHPVVVDYFLAGQWNIAAGSGHIQTWSLKEPDYQINAMPSKIDSASDVFAVIFGSQMRNKSSMLMYNQAVEELNGNNKESIVILLNDDEYATYKSIVGNWKGKHKTHLSNFIKNIDGDTGTSATYYNVLTSNCSHHTLEALGIGKLRRAMNTIPWDAFNELKNEYAGRWYSKKTGLRFAKIPGVGDRVPDEYANPRYVINNADTIAANGWTIAIQQTIWAQLDPLKKIQRDIESTQGINLSSNPYYDQVKKAIDAINTMHRKSMKLDGNWDKTYGEGTKDAVQQVQKVLDLTNKQPFAVRYQPSKV